MPNCLTHSGFSKLEHLLLQTIITVLGKVTSSHFKSLTNSLQDIIQFSFTDEICVSYSGEKLGSDSNLRSLYDLENTSNLYVSNPMWKIRKFITVLHNYILICNFFLNFLRHDICIYLWGYSMLIQHLYGIIIKSG